MGLGKVLLGKGEKMGMTVEKRRGLRTKPWDIPTLKQKRKN